jgi:hypothetical protein
MSSSDVLRHVKNAVIWLLGPRRQQGFTCGDCSMTERCGLPPSEQCVARAAQIASGRGKPRSTASQSYTPY